MKTKNLTPTLAIVALTIGLLGCEKKSETGTPASTNSSAGTIGDTLKDAANTAAAEVKKVAEEVKTTAEKTVTDVTQQAQSLTTTAGSKAQEYIDKAKTFVSQQKYQDAMSALKQLGNLSLSPEQQKAVDDLKKAIQNALGAQATTNGINAVQGLLNK
jgi:ElaB/YqjD/DUF883 family membrane-anchored ribosome-binding protein